VPQNKGMNLTSARQDGTRSQVIPGVSRPLGDPMTLAPSERRDIETLMAAYCGRRVPEHLRNQVNIGFRIRGEAVTLLERRPPLRATGRKEWTETLVAQFRRDSDTELWRLYCADRNSRWHAYAGIRPAKTLTPLLAEVDRDPTGIFWG